MCVWITQHMYTYTCTWVDDDMLHQYTCRGKCMYMYMYIHVYMYIGRWWHVTSIYTCRGRLYNIIHTMYIHVHVCTCTCIILFTIPISIACILIHAYICTCRWKSFNCTYTCTCTYYTSVLKIVFDSVQQKHLDKTIFD